MRLEEAAQRFGAASVTKVTRRAQPSTSITVPACVRAAPMRAQDVV
jgi:hypothetical protein